MTTLVQTRQPLQVLSMSNQPKRRRSERTAGMSLIFHRNRVLQEADLDRGATLMLFFSLEGWEGCGFMNWEVAICAYRITS